MTVGELRALLANLPAERKVILGVCDADFNPVGGIFLDLEEVLGEEDGLAVVQLTAWTDIVNGSGLQAVPEQLREWAHLLEAGLAHPASPSRLPFPGIIAGMREVADDMERATSDLGSSDG